MNSYAEHRLEVLATFATAQPIADSSKQFVSGSGLYRLETQEFQTHTGWAYSLGVVTRVGADTPTARVGADTSTARVGADTPIAEIKRNYGHFWHAWVQHPNGKEYLLCGEDYQGYNVICLETGENRVYFPESGLQGRGFCWAAVHPSPDGLVLAVDGCYWACPYELVFVDFSDPLALPLPELARFEDLKDTSGWQDNHVFGFELFDEDGRAATHFVWQRPATI
jgi:hypothetical protein